VSTNLQSDVVSAGWYADPEDDGRLRWWDGEAWTTDVIAVPEIDHEAVAEAVVVPEVFLSRRELREKTGPLITGSPEEPEEPEVPEVIAPQEPAPHTDEPQHPTSSGRVVPTPPVARPWLGAPPPMVPKSSIRRPSTAPTDLGSLLAQDRPAYVPMGSHYGSEASASGANLTIAKKSITWAVWVLALLPIVHFALIWLLIDELHTSQGLSLRYVLFGAPTIVYLALARADHQALIRNGHGTVAHTGWAVIPPLYLLIRCVRAGGASVWPLIAWLLLEGAAIAFLVLQSPAVFGSFDAASTSGSTLTASTSVGRPLTEAERAAQLTPTGMAAKLQSDLVATKLKFSDVTCPAIPSTDDGTRVVCTGMLASVKMDLTVLIDSAEPNVAFGLVGESVSAQ
jgi:hypothetical protein